MCDIVTVCSKETMFIESCEIEVELNAANRNIRKTV